MVDVLDEVVDVEVKLEREEVETEEVAPVLVLGVVETNDVDVELSEVMELVVDVDCCESAKYDPAAAMIMITIIITAIPIREIAWSELLFRILMWCWIARSLYERYK